MIAIDITITEKKQKQKTVSEGFHRIWLSFKT